MSYNGPKKAYNPYINPKYCQRGCGGYLELRLNEETGKWMPYDYLNPEQLHECPLNERSKSYDPKFQPIPEHETTPPKKRLKPNANAGGYQNQYQKKESPMVKQEPFSVSDSQINHILTEIKETDKKVDQLTNLITEVKEFMQIVANNFKGGPVPASMLNNLREEHDKANMKKLGEMIPSPNNPGEMSSDQLEKEYQDYMKQNAEMVKSATADIQEKMDIEREDSPAN